MGSGEAHVEPARNRNLKELVRQIAAHGPFKCFPTPKRVRLLFNGAMIADSTSALYVWEHEYYPQFYLPMESFVKPTGFDISLTHGEDILDEHNKTIGGGLEMAVRRENTNDEYRILSEMVFFAADLEGPANQLRNYVKVKFDSADQWFEEDTPIYVHPKDPYKRVDCLQSTTPIRVTMPLNGTDVVLAESATSVHLYETMLPQRYYLPYTSINTIYLRPSQTMTECPYKGVAQYHHVVVQGQEYKDLIWWYHAPTAESITITGLRCFYNEKVDIWMKDSLTWRKLERPKTHFV